MAAAHKCLAACCAALLLSACGQASHPVETGADSQGSLRLQDALGGDAGDFLRAEAPREFVFPADHGLHPGFRNEWWYFTGNLQGTDGRRFGYQLTFFANALPGAAASDEASAWDSPRIWMAHFAVTDAQGQRHQAFERFSRENPGLAGATLQPVFRVWLDDWQAGGSASADTLPWRLQAAEGDVRLTLQLDAQKPPVLQGDAGLSRKSATPGNASYYYSMTRLATRGELQLGSERFAVEGLSWLDREWSTSALDAGQSGWDWFSLQLDDGRELMLYQLRQSSGAVDPFSAGNLTGVDGSQTPLDLVALQLQELEQWTSAAGVGYTTRWALQFEGRALEVRAIVQEQWMSLSLPYWEGAVDLFDTEKGVSIGRGYLEMVR